MDAREQWRRRMACCDSRPRCQACPVRPENAHRSLKELTEALLLGEAPGDRDP
ncbi:MAG: hypothetical protein ACPGQL_03445 [Thermoplasmatota archaeon]